MAFVEIGDTRVRFEEFAYGERIIIPSKKNWFIIIFLGAWLCGWFMGEIFAIGTLFVFPFVTHKSGINTVPAEAGLFLAVWLIGWTTGGVFASYTFLWQILGKEIVELSDKRILLRKNMLPVRFNKEFHLKSIADIRSIDAAKNFFGMPNGFEFWGLSGGSVAFDYGMKTYRFGQQLDRPESELIVNKIKKFLKDDQLTN